MKKIKFIFLLALAIYVSVNTQFASGYYADEYGRPETVAEVAQAVYTDVDAICIELDDDSVSEDKPVLEEVPAAVPKHDHRYEYIPEEGYAICLECGYCINIPEAVCETDGDSTQP